MQFQRICIAKAYGTQVRIMCHCSPKSADSFVTDTSLLFIPSAESMHRLIILPVCSTAYISSTPTYSNLSWKIEQKYNRNWKQRSFQGWVFLGAIVVGYRFAWLVWLLHKNTNFINSFTDFGETGSSSSHCWRKSYGQSGANLTSAWHESRKMMLES